MTDYIPTEHEYRGVGLHAGQSEERLVTVRADLDAVFNLPNDLAALVEAADDISKAPEARLLARALALAILDDAVQRRAPRSRTSMYSRDRIKASAAGCDSVGWQSPTHYSSLLDPGPSPSGPWPVLREDPLK